MKNKKNLIPDSLAITTKRTKTSTTRTEHYPRKSNTSAEAPSTSTGTPRSTPSKSCPKSSTTRETRLSSSWTIWTWCTEHCTTCSTSALPGAVRTDTAMSCTKTSRKRCWSTSISSASCSSRKGTWKIRIIGKSKGCRRRWWTDLKSICSIFITYRDWVSYMSFY